jgi:hypothetical protein
MEGNYGLAVSYRWRFDPLTGQRGPLPVRSAGDLRGNIIPESEELHDHAI